MKKGTKGMLIAAGVFAVAGIGLCVSAVSMGAAKEWEPGGGSGGECLSGQCLSMRLD